ncbi:MAG: ABC transporter substrate-binding protein [Dehalococcoidia bacterium]
MGDTSGPTGINSITRRTLLFGAAGAALLIACGEGDGEAGDAGTTASTSNVAASTPAASATSAGPWQFTDDRGVTITLPKRPERIVAQVTAAASLWNYGVRPMGVFGPQKNADGSQSIEVGNVDLKTVTNLGETHGEIDFEKVAGLQPDLIVSLYYSGDTVWYITEDAMAPMQAIAPLAAIKVQDVPILSPITRFGELSAALGADLNSKENVEAKAGFDAAVNDLKAAITSKPGLKVLVVAGGTDTLSVANPSVATDLIYFKQLGLDIVQPPVTSFWESLSWEQANRYPVDLILTDQRPSTLSHAKLMEKEVWRSLPAVQANQVGAWPWKTYSHLSYTKALKDLTAAIHSARADVV